MKIEIEISDDDIKAQVIQKMTDRLHYTAENELRAMVKDIVLGEVRAAVKEHAAEVLKTMTLPDGRTIKQYVIDRLNNVRTQGMSGRERTRVQETIDNVVIDHAHRWYDELFRPHMTEIKERIKSELVSRLLRETASSIETQKENT